jgi:hypothetical protein
VDSDAALAAWANNTAGNDYTSVLIAPGTFTSAVEVNLTTSGTRVVVGMPGSKLSFTSDYGLRYTATPTTPDYRMEGVNVEVKSSGNNYGFCNCKKLIGCTIDVENSANSNDNYGFYNCTELTNCTGTSTKGKQSRAFSDCTNLINCTGTSLSGTYRWGFYNCTELTNCRGTVIGGSVFYACTNLTNCIGNSDIAANVNSYGFYSCTNLTNCTGGGYNSDSQYIYGCAFYICKNLTNCTATGTGTTGCAFYSCTNLTNCTATGTGTTGYGFSSCKGMVLNKPGSASKTSTYSNCFVSISGSGAAPADTAAGGWNKVTV